jgi:uncharacterized protein (TIGR02118 family)
MTDQKTAATVYVTYQGTPETRFDRDYSVQHHMPLVTRAWQPYGLEAAAAFFPAVDEAGTIAICELRFRDGDALAAALAAPETPAVMADVPHFTDVTPVQVRAGPM